MVPLLHIITIRYSKLTSMVINMQFSFYIWIGNFIDMANRSSREDAYSTVNFASLNRVLMRQQGVVTLEALPKCFKPRFHVKFGIDDRFGLN